ncbi:hypothetical protein PC128_g12531 [Phytophthora cactorum]|nr:hypothetical protein PC128_g12531 [Phytophthora cactorum]
MLLRGKRSLDMALEQSAKRTGPKRGSSPIQAKDTAKIDNSTFFKAVWRELREEGWTSKPPPRNALDLLYRYIRPGSSLKGQEGRDFFIGEQALLDFYLQEIVPSATKHKDRRCHDTSSYSEQCSTTETNSEQQNGTVTLAMDSRSMTCENVLAAGSAQNDSPDDIDYTTDRVRVTEERCAMVDDVSCLNEQRDLRLQQPRICHTGQGKTVSDCMMAGGNDGAIREHSSNEYQTDGVNVFHRLPTLGGVVTTTPNGVELPTGESKAPLHTKKCIARIVAVCYYLLFPLTCPWGDHLARVPPPSI